MGESQDGGGVMLTTPFEFGDKTFHLCLNGAALYDIYEKYGSEDTILSHVEGHDKPSFEATCWILYKLAEQGEIVRRYQGFDRGPMPTEHFFRTNLAPLDIIGAKAAIDQTVRQGFRREERDKDERVDKGLIEWEKKRLRHVPRPISAGGDPVFGAFCAGEHDAHAGADQ